MGPTHELKAVAGRILSKVMDRQRPLWDLTLVHGLKGNRTGLIVRLHHCLADGIAGVGIMNVLLDASPVAPRLPRKKLRLPNPPRRDPLTSLASGVVDSYSDVVKRILSALEDMVEHRRSKSPPRAATTSPRTNSPVCCRRSRRSRSGCGSTFPTADRRNSPGPNFRWRTSKPSGRAAMPASMTSFSHS